MKTTILLFISLFSLCYFAIGQDCSTSFTSHNTGSVITTRPVNMSGTAKVPINSHVWILVQAEGFEGWYPQGNGERPITNSKWVCTVFLGQPGQTGYYEIAIAVVNDDVNQTLKNWVKTAQENGYPPIPFPDMIKNCSISTIRVEKR
jgi:hypothetical protein